MKLIDKSQIETRPSQHQSVYALNCGIPQIRRQDPPLLGLDTLSLTSLCPGPSLQAPLTDLVSLPSCPGHGKSHTGLPLSGCIIQLFSQLKDPWRMGLPDCAEQKMRFRNIEEARPASGQHRGCLWA